TRAAPTTRRPSAPRCASPARTTARARAAARRRPSSRPPSRRGRRSRRGPRRAPPRPAGSRGGPDVPELPEVEVVRAGLERWVVGRALGPVEVLHPRSVRRHAAGAADFADRLAGRTAVSADRRGKYMWLTLDSGEALLAHLGMSGQLLVQPEGGPAERHLRIRLGLPSDGRELRFVDQRTLGHLMVAPLVPAAGGRALPDVIAHIAADPMDPLFDDEAFTAALRRRRTEIKRALLDQSLISGVGNIYADEALWRTRLHWARPTSGLRPAQVAELLGHVRAVLTEALAEG